MKQLVRFVEVSLEEWDPGLTGFGHSGKPYIHSLSSCYAMAWLYKNEHSFNPYYGKKEIRDAAFGMCDQIARLKTTVEWPFYAFCQVYDLLKDELPEEKKEPWREYVDYYISTRGKRPYFYTSFNHESYNALGVLRAGQVFGIPEWEQRGRRLIRQLVDVQTDLGYFNEGPGHGPSMKYNQIQLSGMLLFADYSGDTVVLDACKKLADFMIRYSFPDGSTVGCLEGRQSWSIGYYGTTCYGLDRWAQGKELNRRIFNTRIKWGMLDPRSRYYSFSDWYFCFGGWWLMDEYLSLRPDAPSQALSQDTNGYRMTESGPTFSGGLIRQHDWMVAMSAIKPVPGFNIYRLERQSRLDIWHEKTGLIVGGGHNKIETELPLANFLLLTGYNGVDCTFGLLSGGNFKDKQAAYFPRSLETSLTPDKQVLRESFGQGDVSFIVQPLDKRRLRVSFEYDVFSLEKMYVQLPLIVFFNSKVFVDGKSFGGDKVEKVVREVRLENPTMGSKVRIVVPDHREVALRPPNNPLRWYQGEHGEQSYEPYYRISLLSVKIEPAQGKGGGEFLLEIAD